MSFADLDLDSRLEHALVKSGYKKPTTIQSQVVEVALSQRDILASAPTGTGKTAAYLIPAIQHLLDFPRFERGHARVMILTPTRELATQVKEYGQKLLKQTDLSIEVVTGGRDYQRDADLLKQNLDIVVATPGRLAEYIEQEKFDPRQVEVLIIDEADRMLDMGFLSIVGDIANQARWRKQTMLFSATLEGDGLEQFVAAVLTDPEKCHAEPPRSERQKILQHYYRADNAEHKEILLRAILADCEKGIVFVRSRERVSQVLQQLAKHRIYASTLQGEMTQAKRDAAMVRFKSGEHKLLIATDLAARGLDVSDVSHVINYDLPRTADTYLHRIGRTGRAGAKGTAISIIEAHDFPTLEKIQRYLNETITMRVIEHLKPKSKMPSFKKPKKTKTGNKPKNKKPAEKSKPKKAKRKPAPAEVKQRHRDKKNSSEE